jgi:hypothetical protein
MAYDKFLIGYNDNNSGFQSNVKPWIIADNAFEQLDNVYVLRGRVTKRFGSILMGSDQTESRLRLDTGATYATEVYSGTVPGIVFGVGQMFSVNGDIYTVYQTGTPAAMLASNPATSGTYDTTTGAFTITGELTGQIVWFYPSTPVMGLTQFYNEGNNTTASLAFDTQFSYKYDIINSNWYRISSGVSTWTGMDYDFFWMTPYQGAFSSLDTMWVTNFTTADGIRYYDNVTWIKPVLNWTLGSSLGTSTSGTVPGASGFIGQVFTIGNGANATQFIVTASSGALTPVSNATSGPLGTGAFDTGTGAYVFSGTLAGATIYFTGNNYIQSCQIIVEFKNRLVLLNTIELVDGVSTNFPMRARYSSAGSALSASSWMQDVPSNGNAIDAPSQEAIITAQFVKDRLIVYFTSSTYELVYNGNQTLPFVWQKINNELGAISTFSEIPFDKVTLGIDDTGIHACNGSNVDRIDTKIPQFPFGISNEMNGQDRVAGIRDYYNEMAYWSICTSDRNDSFYFPNQVLVYNYINESWATIDDSFTTFGYFFLPPQSVGITWGDTSTPWGQNGNLWNFNSSTTNNTTIKSVLAGNQEGFVVVLQHEIFNNAPSLQVTNFTINGLGNATISCINHNLFFNEFVLFSNMNGLIFTDSLGNVLPTLMARVTPDPVNANTPNSFSIIALDNASQGITITGTYLGGGVIQTVSNINILTKQYNFYTEQDRNMYLARVDFLVDKTINGAVTADYLISSTGISLVSEGLGTLASPGPLPGNSTLETSPYALSNLEQYQSRLWHPIYMWGDGECVQLQLYMSPNQMYSYLINPDASVSYTALNDFELHAMVFYVTPTSYRMQ